MAKQVVILGAGTGGTLMAHKLARRLPEDWQLTVVDQDDVHLYQPGLLFLPFQMYRDEEVVRSRRRLLPARAALDLSGLRAVDPHARTVRTGEHTHHYDLLLVATGTRLAPEETAGLPAALENGAHDYYTLDGARRLRAALDGFTGGTLAVHVAEMPIKCPVAPLEFAFLADAFLTERGLRDKVELLYVTPLDGAFTKPRASAALGELLTRKHITVVPEFAVSEVDGAGRTLRAHDGRALEYDLLATVPVHAGSEGLRDSGLTDAMGFVRTDRHTLKAMARDDVFAIGDCTDLPTSKAGSVAHFQGEVLIENALRFVEGRPPEPLFDGHANCFIETGHGKAILIDFNYDTEPLPGRFPLPGVGPFTLLEESAVNHWGKLMFKWLYWEVILPGRQMPIGHRMTHAGKWS